jgi:hypothetical protein
MIRIQKARQLIRENKLKKDGKNEFSRYDYFTPEMVEKLVSEACDKVGIIPIFSLQADEFGMFGQVNIYDLENKLIAATMMRTVAPSIKATNETQQMGGCMTYTRRYMLMSLFGIMDNSLDFDAHDNRPKAATTKNNPPQATGKPLMNDATFNNLCTRLYAEGEELLEKAKKAYALTSDQIAKAEIILSERSAQ